MQRGERSFNSLTDSLESLYKCTLVVADDHGFYSTYIHKLYYTIHIIYTDSVTVVCMALLKITLEKQLHTPCRNRQYSKLLIRENLETERRIPSKEENPGCLFCLRLNDEGDLLASTTGLCERYHLFNSSTSGLCSSLGLLFGKITSFTQRTHRNSYLYHVVSQS